MTNVVVALGVIDVVVAVMTAPACCAAGAALGAGPAFGIQYIAVVTGRSCLCEICNFAVTQTLNMFKIRYKHFGHPNPAFRV